MSLFILTSRYTYPSIFYYFFLFKLFVWVCAKNLSLESIDLFIHLTTSIIIIVRSHNFRLFCVINVTASTQSLSPPTPFSLALSPAVWRMHFCRPDRPKNTIKKKEPAGTIIKSGHSHLIELFSKRDFRYTGHFQDNSRT